MGISESRLAGKPNLTSGFLSILWHMDMCSFMFTIPGQVYQILGKENHKKEKGTVPDAV